MFMHAHAPKTRIGLAVRVTRTAGWLAPPLNDLLPGQVYVQVRNAGMAVDVCVCSSHCSIALKKQQHVPPPPPTHPPNNKQQNLPSLAVAHVLRPAAGSTVIDLCACPGGKATHLAALVGRDGLVVACDRT